ncbi:thermonuclease family protein [Noviherbaspirillum sedimenti]|uniref:Thermonuclease family protein n=2 Tax=Noviherbaspirillum sedimenti TaxID=2320865 RepID=A0A3A3GDQ7_9BURK|nr:thermonuclease family protein [Noviherbaspirillum sedimenti]
MNRSPCLYYLTAFFIGLIMQPAMADADISSYAFVREDGALQIDGRLVYLYGIYIPPTDQTCYTFIRPVRCSSRAALALDFKISGDFVRCQTRFTNPDGSLIASCTSGDDDLSEWMLQKGWAVALPDAPFSYSAMEKIAQARGLGIWGIPLELHKRRAR